MKESYVKGLANHNDPESCGGARKSDGEALTGESAGRVLSRESSQTRDADAVEASGRQQPTRRKGEARWYPARSKTPSLLRQSRKSLLDRVSTGSGSDLVSDQQAIFPDNS